MLQTDCQPFSLLHVSRGMVNPIETVNLLTGFVDVIRDDEQGAILLGYIALLVNLRLHIAEPLFSVGSTLRVEQDIRFRNFPSRLCQGQRLESLVLSSKTAG